ncbi:glycosyltransferase family 4 protein [Microbacterium sp. HD4P20]|uniref:glycosyltransferase family 4 protein n=1 Tax=Microbacterium sp. HD4P20 TaxID=2864874 RepID=UPI001C641044|nr:glycosyltransferase family 4 protein [Microbacterium sp. HD4P20]MCP2637521.1 glycosyltransferase family 4 protein [Microbacterium sp. HD4P20]
MRIAFIVNNFPPRTGGVELHVQALAHQLAELGHTPIVITLDRERQQGYDGDVRVLSLREHLRVADTLGFPAIGSRRVLTRFLRAERIDVVSVHTRFFPMSFVGLRAARAAGVPVVHTEHGSDHVASDSAVIRIASRLVDETVGRWVLRHADRVLGVSEAVTAFVQRLARVDAQVFYNAIDAPASAPSTHTQDTRRIVFVGRLVPGKGWDAFLDVVAQLRTEGVSISGDVIGDGPEMAAVLARVQTLGLEAIVRVHGRLSQNEVRRLLRGATLVNPTTLSEGFQTTLLEAAAEGARVVTYAVPGADVLRGQGAPIVITERKTLSALSTALKGCTGTGWSPIPAETIVEWTWPARAREFAAICESVRHRATPAQD